MLIEVTREACCTQDDQIGPLEAIFEVPEDGTLGDLVRVVTASAFLQYSSTHTKLTAFGGERPLAHVFGDGRDPDFIAPAEQPLRSVMGPVSFRFVRPPG